MNRTDSPPGTRQATAEDLISGRLTDPALIPQRREEIRARVVLGVSNEDVREVVSVLVASAKAGDIKAIRELLDRTIGKAGSQDPGLPQAELVRILGQFQEIILAESPPEVGARIVQRVGREIVGPLERAV